MNQQETAARQAIARHLRGLFPSGCRRLLFVVPPQIPAENFRVDVALSRRYFCFPPYGPGLLAAAAKAKGCKSEIIDLNFSILSHIFEVGRQGEVDRNRWRKLLLEHISRFQPDLVALSCMFTMTHESMVAIAKQIKAVHGSLPIVAGGVHVSNDTSKVLTSCPEIDFAVKGEADTAFPSLLDFLSNGASESTLSQVAVRVKDVYLELPRTQFPSAESISLRPDYGNLEIQHYNRFGRLGAYEFMHGNRPASTVLSNRGCRARCTFCSVRQFNGPGVRGREARAVVDEVEHLYFSHGIRHIMWLDDDLLYNPKRALELFRELERRKLDLTWDASNGIIAAAITHELMQAMVASGCIGMHLGLESGDPAILRSVKKPGTVETYLRAGEILKCYPEVFVKGFLIIGFPDETVGQLLNTVRLAHAMELGWYAVSILTPLASTEIYEGMKERGLLEDNLENASNVSFSNTDAKQRAREEQEKEQANDFMNLFEVRDSSHIPTKDELKEFWFLMDYRVNYEKIFFLKDERKIRSIATMLEEVCDRITQDNALGNLFLGVALAKLNQLKQARHRAQIANSFLKASAYWQKRFDGLGLRPVLEELMTPNTLRSTDVHP